MSGVEKKMGLGEVNPAVAGSVVVDISADDCAGIVECVGS